MEAERTSACLVVGCLLGTIRIAPDHVKQRDLLPNFQAIRLGNPPSMHRLKHREKGTIELLNTDLRDTFAFDDRQGRPYALVCIKTRATCERLSSAARISPGCTA